MKKFILTVLAFLSFGAYNSIMAQGQDDAAQRNPDLNNSGKYTGNKKDGKMHGKGVYEWKNGDRFEGNFVNGQIDGYGRYSLTRVSGRTASAMVMVSSHGQTATHTKASG